MTVVENGQPGESIAALLCSLSFTSSLGMGQRLEHGLRTAYLGLRLAERLGLPEEDREAVYYGALLKDTGCSACAAAFAAFFPDDELVPRLDFLLVDPLRVGDLVGWFSRNVPLDAHFPERIAKLAAFVGQCVPLMTEGLRAHCEIAEMLARRLGFGPKVQQALGFQWERWDGWGLAYRKKGPEIPSAAHVLHAAQALELVHAFAGPAKARDLARDRRGKRFEPFVAETFLALTADESAAVQ
jgi:response regulator RpfG family c-di-GMP phosphodiesterase